MQASYKKHLLQFKVPAHTSRGSYNEKVMYLLTLSNGSHVAVAEAAPLPDLSIDSMPKMEEKMLEVCTYLNEQNDILEIYDVLQLQHFPSIQFALECAFEKLKYKEPYLLFHSAFTEKKEGIPINGLVWMASKENMWQQIEQKIEAGYTCIKLKIGALDFDEECRLLEQVRKKYSAHKITLRVDANGAFTIDDAKQKLNDLATFELHSIEQPIKSNQHDAMQQLCAETKLPIALDEELIGANVIGTSEKLLNYIRPQFIVLKPTLLGGFKNCNRLIDTASKNNIGWWITSALESNIGLNAIAQYCGTLKFSMPQGLGTGALYVNNFEEYLTVKKGILYFDKN